MFVPLYDHNPLNHIVRPHVNHALILATIAVFVVFQSGALVDGYYATVWGLGLTPAHLFDGTSALPGSAIVPEWATLVTYAFVHGDILHLLGNIVFLWVFGDNIEDALGHARYVVFYAATAASGGLLHALMMPESTVPLVGASGAISGVVAAYLVLHPRTKLWILVLARVPLRITARWPLSLWVAMQFVFVLSPGEDNMVAWWAHIGGLAAGAVLVVVMRRPGVALFDRDIDAERTG
jgi:membrane associated rhomboid family serine protease